MSKARSAVASGTQQSRQTVPKSRTEYRERPKATWVQTATTSWWPAVECRRRLCAILDSGTQSAARYRDAAQIRQRRVNMTRSGTSSQPMSDHSKQLKIHKLDNHMKFV